MEVPHIHAAPCLGYLKAVIPPSSPLPSPPPTTPREQHMVVDMFALAVSAGMMFAVRNSDRGRVLLPLVAFPLLAAADLWAIYNELKSIELKMLNRERSEMIAERWLATGRAPTAGEVGRGGKDSSVGRSA